MWSGGCSSGILVGGTILVTDQSSSEMGEGVGACCSGTSGRG
jgi:hypothetical protein